MDMAKDLTFVNPSQIHNMLEPFMVQVKDFP